MKVGILGGGQLGRMLALAGYPLGLRFSIYDAVHDAPAGHLAPLTVGGFDQYESLDRWADSLDVITYEFENVPVEAAIHLASRWPVSPPPAALKNSQDRLVEKDFLRRLNVPTPQYRVADTLSDLREAIGVVGLPCVVKTRTGGYDGKGQLVVRSAGDVDSIGSHFNHDVRNLIVEQFVTFERELSILAVRGKPQMTAGTLDERRVRTGGTPVQEKAEVKFYPLVENTHAGGILRRSVAPAPSMTPELQQLAESYAGRVLEELDYVGVLAIEFFQLGDQLIANEMAPRVHNSGHWTIEGAVTSQFENHVRAVAGLPLGSTAPVGHSIMLNLIGHIPSLRPLLGLAGVHVHLYGKEARTGRKVGHVTCRGETANEVQEMARHVTAVIAGTMA
ncbi:MAG: 5-(carboxyamino)imidazole ribonucleotide synthase [Pyrinomonadaceae bacterium]|nr:5-(carboxyamino)imidazole ribonucleotide synthase [Phycisphaerales bacterium]